MFPITVMKAMILSLRIVRSNRTSEARRGERGGGLLERPAVNLQTETPCGNGVGQESSNFTAQLCLVAALESLSLSPLDFLLSSVPRLLSTSSVLYIA